MSNRAAAVAYLSIITGSCMGLALVHAGTGNGAVRDVLVGYLSMLLRLRGGKMLRFQKQRATSKEPSIIPENYSVPFMKLCTEHKSAKMLVEMFFSCMCLSVGVVMSGTGIMNTFPTDFERLITCDITCGIRGCGRASRAERGAHEVRRVVIRDPHGDFYVHRWGTRHAMHSFVDIAEIH